MIAQEFIRAKRDGEALSEADIKAFIAGLTSGAVSEGQAAAFAMAIFFRGMSETECAALTRAMTLSGKVLDWTRAQLPGPILDKQSTGGVGDNISLILAPAIAACGGFVPMISGRGLGHTGGTLDKLESIPGYNAQPDEALFKNCVAQVGCAIIGQTDELAPADRRLYAIRDVTATVESIPLITASILSKKLAAGLQGLVMDVKTGCGAFMASLDAARALAGSLARVATAAGLPTVSLVTDMDQPLASAAGNALEIRHAIEHLTGARREARVETVTLALGAEMLLLGGLAPDLETARAKVAEAITSGAAAERFARMVHGLGGPADLLDRPERYLAEAPLQADVFATRAGFVNAIDTRAIGLAVVKLGGGRSRPQDGVDHAVGLSGLASRGSCVDAARPLATIHARDEAGLRAAVEDVQRAFRIADAPGAIRPAIIERITS